MPQPTMTPVEQIVNPSIHSRTQSIAKPKRNVGTSKIQNANLGNIARTVTMPTPWTFKVIIIKALFQILTQAMKKHQLHLISNPKIKETTTNPLIKTLFSNEHFIT